MSESNGNGRVISLNDHRKRQPTRAEVEQKMANDIANIAAAAAKEAVIPVVEFYVRQIPGLVSEMLAQAFAANGMTLQGPPSAEPVTSEVPESAVSAEKDGEVSPVADSAPVTPDGHTSEQVNDDGARAQHAGEPEAPTEDQP